MPKKKVIKQAPILSDPEACALRRPEYEFLGGAVGDSDPAPKKKKKTSKR